MDLVLFALWFFLPAGLANTAPLFGELPVLRAWKAPMDFGAHYRGKRVFGTNKTWRGLILGIVIASLALWLQVWLFENYAWAQNLAGNVDYSSLPILTLGTLFAVGALGGDAIESFFKRQRNINPGSSWFPFDQLDYIVGGLLASAVVVQLTFQEYLAITVIWFCLHILGVYIGYILGIREAKI